MSKSSRNRQRTAREKIAQARELEARRRRRRLWLGGLGAAVVAAAAVAITLAVTGGQATGGSPASKLAPLHTLGHLQPAPARATGAHAPPATRRTPAPS